MENVEIVSRVIAYLSSDVESLQVASVFCVTNLIRTGAGPVSTSNSENLDRQLRLREIRVKLREMGVEKQLQTLLATANSNLCDR